MKFNRKVKKIYWSYNSDQTGGGGSLCLGLASGWTPLCISNINMLSIDPSLKLNLALGGC